MRSLRLFRALQLSRAPPSLVVNLAARAETVEIELHVAVGPKLQAVLHRSPAERCRLDFSSGFPSIFSTLVLFGV